MIIFSCIYFPENGNLILIYGRLKLDLHTDSIFSTYPLTVRQAEFHMLTIVKKKRCKKNMDIQTGISVACRIKFLWNIPRSDNCGLYHSSSFSFSEFPY